MDGQPDRAGGEGSLRTPATRAKAGFTLLEIVISVSLFAIGVTVLLSSYLNVINALHEIQVDQHFEQDIAMVRREALQVGTIEEFEDGGELETGSHGLARWEGEWEPTQVADLFKVRLLVEMHGGEELEEMVQTEYSLIVTRPTWSDPIERDALREVTRERYLAEQRKLDRN